MKKIVFGGNNIEIISYTNVCKHKLIIASNRDNNYLLKEIKVDNWRWIEIYSTASKPGSKLTQCHYHSMYEALFALKCDYEIFQFDNWESVAVNLDIN